MTPIARILIFLGAAFMACPALRAQERTEATLRPGDHIVAVVNQELVTAFELNQRMAQAREQARRENQRLPAEREFRTMILESLVEDRAMLSYARDSGVRIDDVEIDRAVAVIASQNQLTPAQLRARLAQDGLDLPRFRAQLKDQLLIERVREREVAQRIRVTDGEIDEFIDKQRGAASGEVQYNIAQVLIKVPESASEAVVAERRARAEVAAQRVRAGEDFATVARQLSEDDNRERGGEIGLRPADRLPDIFLETVRTLKDGQVAPGLLRTGAGFHLLKLIERAEGGAFRVEQTRARHILLRPNEQLSEDAARARLAEFKRQIIDGTRRFEDLAREHSLDGSAAAGGDLGWASPGQYVPEFEAGMNPLPPGGISDPVTTRFGVHLIQVLERRNVALDAKQLREQARAALRERKFEAAYGEWLREVRGRAYVEFRDAPQ
ncbi:MAG: peptidylprolyl isomerase [Aquincola sp.]|nr:peptidylprolyl isomerase [Aquincola sp.]MDH4288251.1 peptidylprolyl isomerase [Aquincola sp.]MDH5328615.1 peptidylprolyl isomerase [Aquincola sp.]